MALYRKRPVVVEARQWDSTVANASGIIAWILREGGTARFHEEEPSIHIDTLEGTHRANPGDWIIEGVAHEFYPCKPDIFEATYEAIR